MKIKAIMKKPFGQWWTIEVENSPEAFEKEIGGVMMTENMGDGIMLVCRQERGLLDDTKYNFTKGGYAYFGNVLLVSCVEGNFIDVPEGLIARLEGTTDKI